MSGRSRGTHAGMDENSEDQGEKAGLTFMRLPMLIIGALLILVVVYVIAR